MHEELTRAQVDAQYKWDLTRIYADDAAWERAFAQVRELGKAFAARRGTLSTGREAVLEALNAYAQLDDKLTGVVDYASLHHAQDSTDSAGQAMLDRAYAMIGEVSAASAFFEPELLALPEEELAAMADDPAFADYDAFIRRVLHMKPHTLSEGEERLLALSGEVRLTASNAFSMLADADLDLGMTRGEDGKKVRLTDARLRGFLESNDRAVRRSAYLNMMAGYGKMGHTIAALYAGQVKADLFTSRARGFESPRQAQLYPGGIGEEIYDSLIDAVHGGIGTL